MDKLKVKTTFNDSWWIYEYELDGDEIRVKDGSEGRFVRPFESASDASKQPLYVDFANLAGIDDLATPDRILAFANQHGLLYRDKPGSVFEFQIEQKLFNFFISALDCLKIKRKEERQQELMRLLAAVGPVLFHEEFVDIDWDIVKERTVEELQRIDPDFRPEALDKGESWNQVITIIKTGLPRDVRLRGLIEIITYLLVDELMRQGQAQNVQLGLWAFVGKLEPHILFDSLLAAMYTMAWLDLSNDLFEIRQCALPDCRQTFRTKSKKKIYHDRSCATIAAKRAHRIRVKEEEAKKTTKPPREKE